MEKLSGDHDARIAQAKIFLKRLREETPANLLVQSIEQHLTLAGELSELSDEQAAFSPNTDEWSILDVCNHLTHSVRNIALLIRSLLRGKVPKIPGGIQAGMRDESIVSLEESLGGLQKGFAALAQATERLEQDWDEALTMDHPWLSPMNCKAWVAFNILHVRVHMDQITRIKANENFPSA